MEQIPWYVAQILVGFAPLYKAPALLLGFVGANVAVARRIAGRAIDPRATLRIAGLVLLAFAVDASANMTDTWFLHREVFGVGFLGRVQARLPRGLLEPGPSWADIRLVPADVCTSPVIDGWEGGPPFAKDLPELLAPMSVTPGVRRLRTTRVLYLFDPATCRLGSWYPR